MNITLSADEQLIQKTRQEAARRGTSLNQLIREFMEEIAGNPNLEKSAEEFYRNAIEHGGRSADGFKFNREEVHRRKSIT